MASTIAIRLASPQEGPLVKQLVQQGGGPAWEWLDWSQVYPYWLIGEVDGQPKGTIMVHPGVPFGRMEYLALSPSLSTKDKARLCRDLSYAGIASCKQMGSQAVVSNIDSGDASWRHIAQRRGWISTGEGSYMMKRCI